LICPIQPTKRSLMPLTSSDSQDTRASLATEIPPDAPKPEAPNPEVPKAEAPKAPTMDGLAVESEMESGTESASYVKLAMRNMVKKGRKSLTHFFLTTTALIGLLVGLSYLTR